MWRIVFLLILITLITSCEWSPERDNPFDPNSTGYREPAPLNRPPQIETFYATTHYWHSELDPISKFELVCVFSDPDHNIPADMLFPIYYEEDSLLGYLSSDPVRQVYYYAGDQDDLHPGTTQHDFTVYVTDDSGSTASASTFIRSWSNTIIPVLVNPPPQENPFTELRGPLPRVSWSKPSGEYACFALTLYLRGIFEVWDTVGISINDTVAYLRPDVVHNADGFPEYWYSLYLTLWDNEGNSGTGKPGNFWYYYQPEFSTSESYRREEYDY